MASNIDTISFRNLDNEFLLVKDIDIKTRMLIENSGFRIRQDDNAMLVYGYIDQEAGLSFELLCAACIYDDGEVAIEPANKSTSFKFRYGSFQGDVIPFTNKSLLTPFYDRAMMIKDHYAAPSAVQEVRAIHELDPSRAPGYPDDVVVFFIMEGYRNEGIWCRTIGTDLTRRLIQMRMLNEPNAPFGKHIGDVVDVTLIQMDNEDVDSEFPYPGYY